ncbi:serine hydrolase domain-containing protein [Mycolicibacterium neoaurum]|uniref:serine hydrolase domain-containing protein n=1 Tax=Mycolicibacterium neoaurum TaxID=1795 RepID=UPI0026733226|nr:serine hydrolase domain-containing protein [Mycolicibacterium neoaurum]MDO3401126.1 serine hydrolase domain-containing protein [Mycolicibacterium neoaurum]
MANLVRPCRVVATVGIVCAIVAISACGHQDRPRSADTSSSATASSDTVAVDSPAPGESDDPSPPPAPIAPAAFAALSGAVEEAIAAHRLPGAVVQVGHGGTVVFRRAFGDRRLAGEPGLDGTPSPAEPMTTDTLFDLASLTKSLVTATAVMQLREQGRVDLDEPVQTYLPGFNPTGDPRRALVTVRMLLTHSSGIAGDLSLDGPWGLEKPDKPEGLRRAQGAWVVTEPGQGFHYSDIGFILLGAIVEKLTGRDIDEQADSAVFAPLGMADTGYLPLAKACGPHDVRGGAVVAEPDGPRAQQCATGTWSTDLLARIAPTSHDGDTPGRNPDFGYLLRGTVHDPTARRMGSATGSAGVFTTASDIGRFAQALLDRLAGRESTFPLTRASAELMTRGQQLPDGNVRALGWDVDTAHSAPRGSLLPVGSFGHTGFTGTSLWIDPGSDTYIVVLANVIHQPGGPPIGSLAGRIATEAARALHLYG